MDVVIRELAIGNIRIQQLRFDDAITDEAQQRILEEQRCTLVAAREQGILYVTFIDIGESYSLTAKQRRYQGDWLKATEQLMIETTLGLGFVVRSGLIRGVITAVYWMAPPAVPYQICSTTSELLAWVFAVCAQHGQPVPQPLREECLQRFHAD